MRRKAIREALTPEFQYPEAKVVWTLRGLLAALFVYAVWANVSPAETTSTMLVTYPLWAIPISLGFAFVPTRRPRTLKAAEAFTLAALMLHTGGHALGWYDAFWWYDKGLHFVNPLVTVFILFALSQATGWIWNWRRVGAGELFVYVFAMAVTVGVIWEIIEFGMDSLLGTKEQAGLTDTMVDLMLDVAGAAVGALVVALATRYGHEHGQDEISEEPKRPVPARAPLPGRGE